MNIDNQHSKLSKIVSLTVASTISAAGTMFFSVDNAVAQNTYSSYAEYCRNYNSITSAATKATVRKLTELATIYASENSDMEKVTWDRVVGTDLCNVVEPHLKQFEQVGHKQEGFTPTGIELNSADLGPLVGLNRLRGLSVTCDGEAQNLDAIASLTSLENLELINCVIPDVGPLSGLTNLKELNLEGNSITDLTPLTSLTSLEKLYLTNQTSPEQKLRAIANDTPDNLPEGGLIPGILEDVSPLASMINLKHLNLSKNNIRDVSPLNSLVKLSELHLNHNNITDISSLTALTSLLELNVSFNSLPPDARVCPVRESSCQGLESYQADTAGNSATEAVSNPETVESAPQQTNNDSTSPQVPPAASNEPDRSIEETIEEAPGKILDSLF